MNKIKKSWVSYKKLGTNTRFIIRVTLIVFTTLLLSVVYLYNASHLSNHYELLLITDDLIECAKTTSGIGFMGMLIVGAMESNT